MAETRMVRRAKVTLKGAKTYKLAGKTFIKGVSQVVTGSDVDEFMNNAYFHCREIEAVEKKVKKKKKKKSEDSDKKASKKKKSSEKSTKKKSKKKVNKKKKK